MVLKNEDKIAESKVVAEQDDENITEDNTAVEGATDEPLTVGEESEGEDSVEEDSVEEDSVEEVLAKMVEEKKACEDKLLRLAAEFENSKKRISRERDNALKYAEENIIKELLPTIDNLERALEQEHSDNVAVFMEGVGMTLKGLVTTLEKFGLKAVSSVGEPFDPNFHEAMVMEESEGIPAQCVIREFEKGYIYKERMIRAAKVVVSKGSVEGAA